MSDTGFITRLARGQALTLTATDGPRRLVVTRGRLWLTVSSAAHDHWLQAGEGLNLAPGEEWVAEAWPEAEFLLLHPASRRRPASRPAWSWRWTLVGQGA